MLAREPRYEYTSRLCEHAYCNCSQREKTRHRRSGGHWRLAGLDSELRGARLRHLWPQRPGRSLSTPAVRSCGHEPYSVSRPDSSVLLAQPPASPCLCLSALRATRCAAPRHHAGPEPTLARRAFPSARRGAEYRPIGSHRKDYGIEHGCMHAGLELLYARLRVRPVTWYVLVYCMHLAAMKRGGHTEI